MTREQVTACIGLFLYSLLATLAVVWGIQETNAIWRCVYAVMAILNVVGAMGFTSLFVLALDRRQA